MGNERLAEIAKETIDVTENGYYQLNGKKIFLSMDGSEDFSYVDVYSPKRLKSIENDEDEFFNRSFWGSEEKCRFYLMDADSFQEAKGFDRPLFMNFANAHKAGGDFLNGAMAQEESLCRCSTLYKSISSDEAREMYDYNNNNWSPVDSDYILISPNVCVFRDKDCNFIEEPYYVSVATIAAPNRRGRAKNVPPEKLDFVMENRLRGFLWAAAREQ